ncbi:hypothetical protein AAG593_09890 [Citromicrobium bathyomarinum]
MRLRVHLIGRRRCDGCRRTVRTRNTFTNGIGWRELCDPCAEAPPAPVTPTAPVLPCHAVIAR